MDVMALRAVSVVVASTQRGGIGKEGGLPWKLPEDMGHFKRVTMAGDRQNAVIMGRKTWDSIPEKFKPLPGRLNVVLTSKTAQTSGLPYPEGILLAQSVAAAVDLIAARDGTADAVGEIFVIGGQAAYEEAVAMPNCARIYMTRVGLDVECDACFPAFDETKFRSIHVSTTRSHNAVPYDFVTYERDPKEADAAVAEVVAKPSPAVAAAGGAERFLHEEYQYLNAIRDVMERGLVMDDRTGVGTRSLFGHMMRFDLRHSFPLLTTKRVFWRGVVEELLWFVRGDTNAKHLSAKGIKIWDGNGSKEFLEKRGLGHREEGDLGPVYGFQWRHFGAVYKDMHTDYTGQGVDQLAECIKTIKENPTDRRILLSAWNPADLGKMALPPCHMFCQFYVAKGELSCLMYQRSCDMGLGVPFNIASYSLLTCMMAQVCGLKPGEFVHSMGNTHVYLNHEEPLRTQLKRTPRPFPVLRIDPSVTDIDGFKLEHFELVGYNPHGTIKMEMAV